MAWLSAVPKPRERSGDAPRRSRLQRMRYDLKDTRFMPDMPPVDVAGHLLAYLWEIGPAMPGGGAISHGEIESWQALTGIELDAWQARTLRQLSSAYVNELHEAEKPDRPAPWQQGETAAPTYAATSLREELRREAAGM